MSGNSLVIDTSVAIDILGGDERAAMLVQGGVVYASVITRVELLAIAKPRTHPIEAAKALLDDCKLVQFSDEIQDITIRLRRKYKLKLPDAAIAATAIWLNAQLVTADHAFVKVGDEVSVLPMNVEPEAHPPCTSATLPRGYPHAASCRCCGYAPSPC